MENREKHLEFVQNNITRMNQCAFQVKGWSITIVSAMLALFAATYNLDNGGKVGLIFAGILPTLLFWLLDTYYLQQERKFVGIYNDIVRFLEGDKGAYVANYDMPITKYTRGKYGFFRVMFSKTEFPLYLSMIAFLLIIGIVFVCWR